MLSVHLKQFKEFKLPQLKLPQVTTTLLGPGNAQRSKNRTVELEAAGLSMPAAYATRQLTLSPASV